MYAQAGLEPGDFLGQALRFDGKASSVDLGAQPALVFDAVEGCVDVFLGFESRWAFCRGRS